MYNWGFDKQNHFMFGETHVIVVPVEESNNGDGNSWDNGGT